MRSIASHRLLVVGSLLVAMGAGSAGFAGQADAASGSAKLSKGKARAHVVKEVRSLASPKKHKKDPNGYVGSFAVVKAGKCEQVGRVRVQCAWGMLWPNGHQESGLMEVTQKKNSKGKVVLSAKNVGDTAEGDDGPIAEAGSSGDFGSGDDFMPMDRSSGFDPFGPGGDSGDFLAPPTQAPSRTAATQDDQGDDIDQGTDEDEDEVPTTSLGEDESGATEDEE